MITRKTRRLGALLVLATLAASCSPDRIAGPAEPEVSQGLLDDILSPVTGLLTCRVDETATATRTIGPAGGTIVVGRHSLYIPAGALAGNVEITATAPAGDHVAVEFAPHGLRFERNTVLRLSYADCGLVRALLLKIAYVDADGATILEILPSLPDLWRQQVIGTTDHFSSYMLAY